MQYFKLIFNFVQFTYFINANYINGLYKEPCAALQIFLYYCFQHALQHFKGALNFCLLLDDETNMLLIYCNYLPDQLFSLGQETRKEYSCHYQNILNFH